MAARPHRPDPDENEIARTDDPRSKARELTIQFLHQLTVQGEESMAQIDTFLGEYGDNTQSRQLARQWIIGTWRMREQLDQLIKASSARWDLSRMNQVDRNNLRLATYQLMYCEDIPTKVIINEAIELARHFSTAQAPSFINGVLDAIRKVLPTPTTAPTPLKE